MAGQLTIPARFNGPLENGQGGYAAGIFAATLEGPVEVTLRRPVPLDTALSAAVEDGTVRVLDGEELIAEGREVPGFDLEAPEPVGVEEAREAMSRYRGLPEGPFSRCFVCGKAREDALGVFAGPLENRPLVASTWTPPPHTSGADGTVRPEFLWAVLDCPTFFAAYLDDEELPISFLARLTARIDAPVAAGEEHVVIAWPLEAEGRKRQAGSALLSVDGEVLARALALMIEPRG
ncbi:MAG TPA: hypothetical protein VFZ41_02040 [Solirubrobacterales bacterium]